MYISIDCQTMNLVRKTLSPQCETESVRVLQQRDKVWDLTSFTTLELQLLYRSLGSVAGTVYGERESLVQGITKLLNMRPTVDYQPELTEEVEALTPVKEVQVKGEKTATIWDVADKMWDAAGKPTDPKLVLKLRKQIMNELEQNYSIKKTTSSTSLGGWQKSRLS